MWGRVSDRVGRKPVLILSLAGTAAGTLLTGLAGSMVLLFAGRIVDGVSGASVSVAHAAVDPNPLSRTKPHIKLARQFLSRTVLTHDVRAPRLPFGAATQAVRSVRAPICQQRDFRVPKHFNLPHDTVSAGVFSGSATARSERITTDSQGIRIFQSLRRRV